MKKKLLSVLLVLTIVLSQSAFFASAVSALTNPFATQDTARWQALREAMDLPDTNSPDASAATLSSQEEESQAYTVQFRQEATFLRIYQCVSRFTYDLLADSSEKLFCIYLSDEAAFRAKYGDIIEYLEPVQEREVYAIPNDPYYDYQWALEDINLPGAWDETTGSADVKVAVIDSGFYRSHEDLDNTTVAQGYDVPLGQAGVNSDQIGHGTMVTSVIAASTNNGIGMAGVCWNVTVVPYKVADRFGNINSADVTAAIILAADAGCDVINISLGGYWYDNAEQKAVDYANARGCIIVAAAGNEGEDGELYQGNYSYPASYDGVISVAATNIDRDRSSFSQFNDKVDISAPGEEIVVAGADGEDSYYIASGTSFSSPYVAAVAALARSQEEAVTSEYFEQLLKISSTDLGEAGKDSYYGWGLINAQAIALRSAAPVVVGVEDNEYCGYFPTIYFNKGTATLNGIPFESGSTVTTEGNYILTVTDSQNRTTTVHFNVVLSVMTISGVEDNKTYNTNVTITFSGGTAELNGRPFISGSTVSREGEYQIFLQSTYTDHHFSYRFYIDKTPPQISGVEDGGVYTAPVRIRFDEGTATLNGIRMWPYTVIQDNGSYVLTVTDDGGNVSTIRFRMNIPPSSEQVYTTTGIIDTNQILLDEETNTLACLKAGSSYQISILDADTLLRKTTLDMADHISFLYMADGKLYVPYMYTNIVAIIDMKTLAVERTITLSGAASKMEKHGNVLYYVSNHLYAYNLETNIDTQIASESIYPYAMTIDHKKGTIYIAEKAGEASIFTYSIQQQKIIGSVPLYSELLSTVLSYSNMIFAEGSLFYVGREYTVDPADGTIAGCVGSYSDTSEIIYVKNNCVYTGNLIFDKTTHARLGEQTNITYAVLITDEGDLYTDSLLTGLQHIAGTTPVTSANAVSRLHAIPVPQVPDSLQSNSASESANVLSMPWELGAMKYHQDTNTILALSGKEKALFFINGTTLNLQKTMRFTGKPNSMAIYGNTAAICFQEADKVVLMDIPSRTVIKTLYMDIPFRIALYQNKLFYSRMSAPYDVHMVDIDTEEDTVIYTSEVSPSFTVNTDRGILYIGATQYLGSAEGYECTLTYYDIAQKQIIGQTENLYSEDATVYNYVYDVFYNDAALYTCGKILDPADPTVIYGNYFSVLDPPIYCDNDYILSNWACFDAAEYYKIIELPRKIEQAAVSSRGDLYIYDKALGIITQYIGEEDLPPEVSGVEDGGGYLGSVTITFNEGTALLDGQPFASGGTVTELGDHILTVTDNGENTVTIEFTIYAPQADDEDVVTIPDAALRQALTDAGVDKDENGIFTKGEMRMQPRDLDISDYGIISLSGMEYALNLRSLDISYNSITDLSPLSGLTGLKSLYADGNGFSNIQPLSNLTALETLSLWNNNISSIAALSGLINLTALDLSYNLISDITPLAGLVKLGQNEGYLALDGNRISNITPLASLTSLIELYLNDNQISNIAPLASLTELKALGLSDNPIADLSPVSTLMQLEYLDIADLGISSLQPVSGLTNLQYLFAEYNNIRDVSPLQNLTEMIFLSLESNQVDYLDGLSGLSNLLLVNLYDNEIGDLTPLMDLPLYVLDVSENFLDTTAGSADMLTINAMLAANPDLILFYTPQKPLSQDVPPVITIAPYNTAPTTGSVTVTASVDKGRLNASSHTFTQNGSFTFIATDAAGTTTTKTVTVTNIDKTPPAAPTGVQAVSAGYNAVTVSWNAVSNASGYRIYRATSAGGTYTYVGQTTALRYTNIGLTTGVTYYFKIQAYRTVGTGESTSVYSSYASAQPILATVTGLKAASTAYNSVLLSWNAVSGASGYVISRATSATGTYSTVATVTGTGYTNIGLTTGVRYYFKVQAYRTIGTKKVYGNNSGYAYATPALTAPASPGAAAYSYNSIRITWSAVPGATGYNITRATSASGTYTTVASVTGTSYINSGLTANTTYYYKIQPYRVLGGKKIYGSTSAVVSAKVVFPAPASPKAVSASYNSIRITWSAVSGATGYNIYRATSANGTYTTVASVTGTSYTNIGLTTGTTYYYKVQPYRVSGSKKIYGSTTGVLSAVPVPAMPTSFTAARYSASSIRLAWKAVTGASGYEIYRATSYRGTYSYVATTSSASYINSGLTSNVTYYYKIRAYRTVNGKKVYGNYTGVAAAKPY